MNYKPLVVASFLVVGGLIFGALVIPKTGVIKEDVTLSGSTFISRAHGAEIDSAALTVQDAPLLVSANAGANSTGSVQSLETFYSNGAMRDPGLR